MELVTFMGGPHMTPHESPTIMNKYEVKSPLKVKDEM